jgi:hypothetical protein
MKMLNDFQQNNNADECHSVACHGTYKLLITSKHGRDDFFPTLLCSIEQRGEFFYFALFKYHTCPARFSPFRSKMDEIIRAE